MNLKAFRKKHGLSTAAVVADLQEYFPKYTKATESMVENPGKYGIELSAKAVKILREKYEAPNGKDFLEFLFNTIQPNEMEQYISMYRSRGVAGKPPEDDDD